MLKLGPQFRSFETGKIDKEKKTVQLSFSSEEPYERWWGIEILDHSPDSVDLTRLNSSAPLLYNHNPNEVIGVVERASIEEKKGYAVVRFGNSEKAKEIFGDVVDGILRNVSVGYRIKEMKLESEKDGVETYRVSSWEPFEVSIVSIPADFSVGVGRNKEQDKNEVKIINQKGDGMKEGKRDNEPKVDVKTAKDEATKSERARVKEITAIGTQFEMIEEANRAIDEGMKVDEFRKIVLTKISERAKPSIKTMTDKMEIGMSDKEVKRYSFAKVLRALANPNDRKAQEEAAFELELSAEAQKRSGIVAQGVLVPFDVFKRDLTVASTNGVTVATEKGDLIDLLRNKSALLQIAETLPGLKGNISFPKQTKAMEAQQLGETDQITDSDIELSELVMSPKRFGGGGAYSKQLLHQSSVAIENLIRNDLMSQIALKIDAFGVTTILNETGVGLVEIGSDGGPIKNSHIVDMETEVAVDNADIGRLAYLLNARTRGYLKKTPITDGNPKMILEGDNLNGYRYIVSNQLPSNLTKGNGTNLSALIFGNFQDLLIGFWGGIDLIVDPYSLSKQGKISIVADQFADVGVRRPESFAVIKDAQV